jgi:large subunit ribosomal protein L30
MATKQLKVTYVKSAIGYKKNQRAILEALGLTKLNSSNILPDNESVRGSIFKVKHLVKVEEV